LSAAAIEQVLETSGLVNNAAQDLKSRIESFLSEVSAA
jgi:hypothetical protein